MLALRGLAFASGAALLAATAHATISASGGYGSSHSLMMLAIAVGVAVSALAIGSAWSDRRALAVWLLIAIAAGEAFGLLSTADRLIAAREAAQAPLHQAASDHGTAAQRVTAAEHAVANTPTTSARLAVAEKAKAAADQTAQAKAADKSCLVNCRQLLQDQVENAKVEVEAARTEIKVTADDAARELAAARTALAAIKAPASATPFADRTGLPAWIVDLVMAALGSIAANGLGCGLIAFAGHGSRQRAPAEPSSPEIIAPRAADNMRRFAVERLFPAAQRSDATPIPVIRAAYRRWCAERGVAPLAGAALGEAMADLFEIAGIPVERRDDALVAVGVTLEIGSLDPPTRGIESQLASPRGATA